MSQDPQPLSTDLVAALFRKSRDSLGKVETNPSAKFHGPGGFPADFISSLCWDVTFHDSDGNAAQLNPGWSTALRCRWSKRVRIASFDRSPTLAQTFASRDFVIAANLGAVLMVLAVPCLLVEPQTTVLWLLATQQPREMQVDFVGKFLRQVGWPKRVWFRIVRSRRIQNQRRTDPQAADATAVTRSRCKNG